MADYSLSSLLSTMASALESASMSIPAEIKVPAEGLSLFNIKNELFLSYLENLAFLLLIKLQSNSQEVADRGGLNQSPEVHKLAVERLAELRLYLDKGVRPLEGRLKYQIDKVVRAADEASRQLNGSDTTALSGSGKTGHKLIQERRLSASSESAGSRSDDESSDEANDLMFRPNTAALVSGQVLMNEREDKSSTAVYKPPKIHPTALPINVSEKKSGSRDKQVKSAAMDDFVANELDTAPMAEPSIGSTIRAGGRATLTARERQEQSERRRYEEENFVRLPSASKKEKKAQASRKKESFGGEEWGGLNTSVDRIAKMVGRRQSGANALERSRKRETSGDSRDSDKRRKLGI